jgi:hypothetical protein
MTLIKLTGAYVLMAFVTLGLISVPHAIYYEHPEFILSNYLRLDLQ